MRSGSAAEVARRDTFIFCLFGGLFDYEAPYEDAESEPRFVYPMIHRESCLLLGQTCTRPRLGPRWIKDLSESASNGRTAEPARRPEWKAASASSCEHTARTVFVRTRLVIFLHGLVFKLHLVLPGLLFVAARPF